MRPRLVILDVDGTLIDSQSHIVASMTDAFAQLDLKAPSHRDILNIVGLSLETAMRHLAPDAEVPEIGRLVEVYKHAFATGQSTQNIGHSAPLFEGIAACLDAVEALGDHVLLGIATGKSRRGLRRIVEGYGWDRRFATLQVADDHPSKPHPAMINAALADCGVAAGDAVMVGDTSYDMEMAKAAGVTAIGVTWGYHDVARLTAADSLVKTPEELTQRIAQIIGGGR